MALNYTQMPKSTSNFLINNTRRPACDDYILHNAVILKGRSASIPWPGAKYARQRIVPVFLPFSGCESKCVFCAQESQTGCAAPGGIAAIRQILAQTRLSLNAMPQGLPVELAFYGGTFTGQPANTMSICLEFAAEMRAQNKIVSFRCSTRPDCIDQSILRTLRAYGCSMVEFGIQSFENKALCACHRGYDGNDARNAILLAKSEGLLAGAQLMPGMPGQSRDAFIDDVIIAAAAGCDALRFYPCQVLAGTKLAVLWREGRFMPWSLRGTMRRLAQGQLLANVAQIPVIRTGLAPQPGFAPLAGPSHPALGSMIQARALILGVRSLAKALGATSLAGLKIFLPRTARGYYGGQKNCLLPVWARMGAAPGQFNFTDNARLALLRP